jgi:hypothetical protein
MKKLLLDGLRELVNFVYCELKKHV